MRILITGANGYIGKSLCTALCNKHQTYAATRQDADLTQMKQVYYVFADTYYDVVIHCAVAGGSRLAKDDWSVMDTNLQMYYNLLNFKDCYGKLIHFGSGAETYMPKEPYGYSKKVIAKSILNQPNFYNLKLFGVFDESELDSRFIKANIKRYIDKEPMQVHENKAMDFFYMQDLIKVVDYYISKEELPKEFDCVYEKTFTTLKDIADIINQLDDYTVDVVFKQSEYSSYTSKYRSSLPIDLVGLEGGIINTYKALKDAAN